MPQASEQTLKNWPHGEGKALQLLEQNFVCRAGWFSPKESGYHATDEEAAAIQYLIEEWDYGYN